MKFKYSICLPDYEDIQYPSDKLDRNQVMELAKKYPWFDQMRKADLLPQKEVYYSPSVCFIDIETNHGFELTLESTINDSVNDLTFSLWYNRPKKVKVLFGLFGSANKMVVEDVSPYNFNDTLRYLKAFVNREYSTIEKLYI